MSAGSPVCQLLTKDETFLGVISNYFLLRLRPPYHSRILCVTNIWYLQNQSSFFLLYFYLKSFGNSRILIIILCRESLFESLWISRMRSFVGAFPRFQQNLQAITISNKEILTREDLKLFCRDAINAHIDTLLYLVIQCDI